MDRSQRSIHHAMMQKIQQYMAKRSPSPTTPSSTFRRPDGMDLTQRAYAKDAREYVNNKSETAQRHQQSNVQQAQTVTRTGQMQTPVQRPGNSLPLGKEQQAKSDNSFAKYTQQSRTPSQEKGKEK